MTANDQHQSPSDGATDQAPSADGISADGIDHQRNGQRQEHIVVVNDTQEILDLFRDILEEEGYRVSLYSYAFKDIADISALQPDLVILDFVIGGEAHGWQLLQKMKMTRETKDIPVIVCTAALQLVRELEGHLKTKNVGVVLKPFDIDELLDAITLSLDTPSTIPSAAIPQPR